MERSLNIVNSAFQFEVRHKSQFELNILSDTLLGSIYEYRSKSTPMYNPAYASPLPPSIMAPNGCGYGYRCGGVVPETRTESTDSTISNVGNSIQKLEVYRK